MGQTQEVKGCPFCGAKVKVDASMRYTTFFFCTNKECGAVISLEGNNCKGAVKNVIQKFNRRFEELSDAEGNSARIGEKSE